MKSAFAASLAIAVATAGVLSAPTATPEAAMTEFKAIASKADDKVQAHGVRAIIAQYLADNPIIGEKGEKGDKGDTGERGIDGIQGVDGRQGVDGAAGPKGDTGEIGPKGDKGDTGPMGPAGVGGAGAAPLSSWTDAPDYYPSLPTSKVTVPGVKLDLPASSTPRTVYLTSQAFYYSGGKALRFYPSLDGKSLFADLETVTPMSPEGFGSFILSGYPVNIPGDNQPHTITLQMMGASSSAGTVGQRWLVGSVHDAK